MPYNAGTAQPTASVPKFGMADWSALMQLLGRDALGRSVSTDSSPSLPPAGTTQWGDTMYKPLTGGGYHSAVQPMGLPGGPNDSSSAANTTLSLLGGLGY